MSTFSAVLAMAEPSSEVLATVARLGVMPTGAPIGRRLLIDVRSTDADCLESLARRVAEDGRRAGRREARM